MSSNNLSSVLKSCSESELINEVVESNMIPKQTTEGSRLKRTFTLPRNPFGSVKPNSGKIKSTDTENKVCNGVSNTEGVKEEGSLERKLFRRPSWKRFINKIAQHMSTVSVPGVSKNSKYVSCKL